MQSSFSIKYVYEDILSVEPAGLVRISNGELTSDRWWKPESWLHSSATIPTIADVFEESISHQAVSDVPICLLLSGGIDSSFLSSYFQGKDIKAIYADFGNSYSKQELSRAKYVAETYNIPFEAVPVF